MTNEDIRPWIQVGEALQSPLDVEIARIISPAIDCRAPYAKEMISKLTKLYCEKLAENESLSAKLQIALEALKGIHDSLDPFETAAVALKQIEAISETSR